MSSVHTPPAMSGVYTPPNYEDEERERLLYQTTECYKASFPDRNPYNEIHLHSAENFAQSGFRFMGSSDNDDRVYCPYCRVYLSEWDHNSDTSMPLEEHKKTEHVVGLPCWFLRELIYKGARPWQQMGEYPQYETLSPEMDASHYGVPYKDGEDDFDDKFVGGRPLQNFFLNDLKREFGKKIKAPCKMCESAEKVTVLECKHVNCKNYQTCNQGKCAICSSLIGVNPGAVVALRLAGQ